MGWQARRPELECGAREDCWTLRLVVSSDYNHNWRGFARVSLEKQSEMERRDGDFHSCTKSIKSAYLRAELFARCRKRLGGPICRFRGMGRSLHPEQRRPMRGQRTAEPVHAADAVRVHGVADGSVGGCAGLLGKVRVPEVPAFIDHRVLPARGLEVGVEPVYILLPLVRRDGKPVGVPAVPAHWRRGGERRGRALQLRTVRGGGKQQQKQGGAEHRGGDAGAAVSTRVYLGIHGICVRNRSRGGVGHADELCRGRAQAVS